MLCQFWRLCIGMNRPYIYNQSIIKIDKKVMYLHKVENCLDVVGLDLWFKLIQRRSRQYRAVKHSKGQLHEGRSWIWSSQVDVLKALYRRLWLWRESDVRFDINGCPIARDKWKQHPTCPIGQVKMILWYVQFLKSKMINIELFSVGSRCEFYLNIASYVSCILRHFVLICWLRNSPFSNKDRVIYISQSPN